ILSLFTKTSLESCVYSCNHCFVLDGGGAEEVLEARRVDPRREDGGGGAPVVEVVLQEDSRRGRFQPQKPRARLEEVTRVVEPGRKLVSTNKRTKLIVKNNKQNQTGERT